MSIIRTHIAEIPRKIGEEIKIKGHAQTLRVQSSVIFIVLRDITGVVQCVIERSCGAFEQAKTITTESVLEITGTVKQTSCTEQGVEIAVSTIKVLSFAEALPIPVIEKGAEVSAEKCQDWRFLTLRRAKGVTIM